MRNLLSTFAKIFLGRGIIDKFLPFLIPLFGFIYTFLQKDELKLVKIPGGRLKVKAKDTSVALSLLLKKEYEPTETKLLLKALRTGDTFLDIGANIGYYTVLASKVVGKKGRVFAFEPDPENFDLLKTNIRLNKCKNVTPENKAVGDKNGSIQFSSEEFNKGESRISKKGGFKVDTVTLDSYLKGIKADVIKMDIEGAEILALKGGQQALEPKNIKLFIEYNPQSLKSFTKNPNELLKLLEELGFKIISIIDETRREKIDYSESNLRKLLSRTTFCNLYCES